ncbi:MAG: DUF3179 domain-containing protein [Nitrosarchaeum sp.]|nr:DUF3179 domain-containing protein [Nitrosarchaeum sp.]
MKYQYPILGVIGVILVVTVFFVSQQTILQDTNDDIIKNVTPETNYDKSIDTSKIQTTDGIKHIIPLDQIKSGGPPKDGIPSIDNPKFVNSFDAEFVSDDDLVIGVNINGEQKAYPLFIMVWHEIVNDSVGGIPVAVTYCPLCFTNQVFDRNVDGKITEFGTSGKLYNSNLVMYDRNTGSQWSQALGIAITGEMTGHTLKRIPFDVARWSDWKSLYPDTLVLTTDTGFFRAYGVDPYGDYYIDSRIIFPVENNDDRLFLKEKILGFENGVYKAYKLSDVEQKKVINDNIGDKKIVLVSLYPEMARAFNRIIDDKVFDFEYSDGKIIDVQTKSIWNFEGESIEGQLKGKKLQREVYDPGFWFEWVAFHPDTLLYLEKN